MVLIQDCRASGMYLPSKVRVLEPLNSRREGGLEAPSTMSGSKECPKLSSSARTSAAEEKALNSVELSDLKTPIAATGAAFKAVTCRRQRSTALR